MQREALDLQRESLDKIQQSIDLQQSALDAQQSALDALYAALQDQYDALQDQQDLLTKEFDAVMDSYNAQLDVANAKMDELEQMLEDAQDRTELDAYITEIQKQELHALELLQDQMEAAYLAQQGLVKVVADLTVQETTTTNVAPIPLPVKVTNPSSSGGGNDDNGDLLGGLVSGFRWGGPLQPMHPADLIPMQRFAPGGLTQIMAEPGERIYEPRTTADRDALLRVNQMIPRFTVPGSGEGDTVPMSVRLGSVVLNKRASSIFSREAGYQGGGTVQDHGSGSAPITVHVTINMNAKIDHRMDIREVANELTRYMENQLRATFEKPRGPGRSR